jgi:hypothetical protein
MFNAVTLFCVLAFFGYGASCLLAQHMVGEFERYGLARFRKVTGILQLMAAIGLLVGLRTPVIGAIAAGGLAIQMLLGFAVRRKIRDNFLQSSPAVAFCLISSWLFFQFLERC